MAQANNDHLESYRTEVDQLRSRVNQLEVQSIEQRASDNVRKWRETFDTSDAKEMERILNDIEKRKQSEVSRLINELRVSLDEFQTTIRERLVQLDTFISRLNVDDEMQFDYVQFELNSIRKKLDQLRMDILVETIDASKRRRSSTALARNTIELVKIFDFNNTQQSSTTTEANTSSTSKILDPLRKFLRRTPSAGASHYNVDFLRHQKHL